MAYVSALFGLGPLDWPDPGDLFSLIDPPSSLAWKNRLAGFHGGPWCLDLAGLPYVMSRTAMEPSESFLESSRPDPACL